MDEPEHSRWGERLRERTQPLQRDDEDYGWAHAILCEALAQPYLQVTELIDPPEPYPPWAPLFSIDLCPSWALPWLAQAVGVRIPTGTQDADARKLILEAAGHKVGTTKAMTSAISMTLVSSRPPDPPTVIFRERDGSAYQLEIITLSVETPDPERTLSVIIASKPGGLVLRYRSMEGWDYQLMTDEGGTYAEQSAAYGTYKDLAEHAPGEGPPPVVPSLESCVPDSVDGTVDVQTDLTLTGVFPDDLTDMVGYIIDVWESSHDTEDLVKVSDTEVTTRINMAGTDPGAGTIQIVYRGSYEPYTNTVPFTVTEAVPPPLPGRLDVVTPSTWEYGVDWDPTFDGDFPFPGGDASTYYAYAVGRYSDAPVTVVSPTQVTAHFAADWMNMPGSDTVEIRDHATGEPFTNSLPINLTV